MDRVEPGTGRAGGVGRDLRALRRARGLTLAELSARVGRSIGWLSQVERGLTEPTIDDLVKLAGTLEQPVSLFFGQSDAPPEERGHVVRAGRRRTLGTPADGLVEELLSPDLGGSFEMLHSVFAPGAEQAGTVSRPTEEAGFIVSGTLELSIGGRLFRLGPGDSFRFSRERTRWRNPGTTPCVAIWVVAPPVY